jgi:hypothetical protein
MAPFARTSGCPLGKKVDKRSLANRKSFAIVARYLLLLIKHQVKPEFFTLGGEIQEKRVARPYGELAS